MLTYFTLLLLSLNQAQSQQIPQWVVEDMQSSKGLWKADNAAYKSEDEIYDEYVLEWKWGFIGKMLEGELYGMKGNERSQTFYKFFSYWDAEEQKMVVSQFGRDGTHGIGFIEIQDSIHSQLKQKFTAPDGSVYFQLHKNEKLGKNSEKGTSYKQGEDGEWLAMRTYIWHKKT